MGRYIAFFSTTLPPIFSHSPFGTYFHSSAALSALAWPAQECFAVAQSFWPAAATPRHFSLAGHPRRNGGAAERQQAADG